MMETYLRRGQRTLERIALSPRVRTAAVVLGCSGSGLVLSAVGLGNLPQPVAMGLLCGASGWRVLLMALGAMVGYPTFWGMAGNQGIVWAAAGGLLAIMINRRPESRDQPLMLPVIAGILTVVTDLAFRLILQENTPFFQLPLRAAVACFSGILFVQASRCRDPVTDWLVEGVLVLALAQLSLGKWLGLGYLAAGLMAVGAAFPAAALAGLALDLAQVTVVPMTAVLSLAYLIRLVPRVGKWPTVAASGAAYLLVMQLCGMLDLQPLPGLILGGVIGSYLPKTTEVARRRGETGFAQVRLELAASVLAQSWTLLSDVEDPPIDEQALIQRAAERACSGCPCRKNCKEDPKSIPASLLHKPLGNGSDLPLSCRKSGRLLQELRRSQEQLRSIRADRDRRREYRAAVEQQYHFLSEFRGR